MLVALAFAFTVRVARAQDYNREDHWYVGAAATHGPLSAQRRDVDDIVEAANDHDDGEHETAR
jgi:hypothetical protein